MEKNLAPGNDGSASLPQNGAPNRPLWKLWKPASAEYPCLPRDNLSNA